jgi:competence protein ComEC
MLKFGWKRLLKAALLTFLIAALFSATVSATSNNLTVHFIDVGQGDSELIQFNNRNVLIDGGEQVMGPRVESYLRDHGVSSLDIMVATHPHSDHVGGLITVLNDTPVKQVLDIGQAHPSPIYETFLKLLDQKNIPYKNPQLGQTIDLDPNLKIEVLNPPSTQFTDDLNQNSIVLKVIFNNVSFLLMGDAGFEAEKSILASGYDLKSDILKVAHHGSSSASSPTFLSKVRPAISVIEVGAGNDYGHPTKKTLDALQQIGTKIYRTDLNGSIVVTTDGVSYTITTQNQSGNVAGISTQQENPVVTPSLETNTSTSTALQQVVGSTKSKTYHCPSCSSSKKINHANERFTSSRNARTEYVTCKVCKSAVTAK